jgi:hypothetical protein
LIGRASIAGRAGSVDDAVDRGIGVIGTADVDLGFCEPFTGEEQRQRGKEVAFVVGHADFECATGCLWGREKRRERYRRFRERLVQLWAVDCKS